MLTEPSKRCPKCDTVKPLTAFSKKRSTRDGLQVHCKTCVKASFNRWYAKPENAAKVVASARQWFLENRAHAREQRKEHYHRSEERRERAGLWAKLHPSERRAIVANCRAKQVGAPGDGLTAAELDAIFGAAFGLCSYCARQRKLVMDHIDALANGGAHDASNVAACCVGCNSSKRHDALIVWLAKMASGRRANRGQAA